MDVESREPLEDAVRAAILRHPFGLTAAVGGPPASPPTFLLSLPVSHPPAADSFKVKSVRPFAAAAFSLLRAEDLLALFLPFFFERPRLR